MAVLPRAELEEMTVIKLRELALAQYPSIQGVSGMKKEVLVEAIIAEEISQGLRPKEEKAAVRAAAGMAALKAQVKSLKADRGRALEAKDRKGLKALRDRIKRIKRKMRRLKEAS
jgi:hypothetical protein